VCRFHGNSSQSPRQHEQALLLSTGLVPRSRVWVAAMPGMLEVRGEVVVEKVCREEDR